LVEKNKKLQTALHAAKQRVEPLILEKKQLEANCAELRKQMEAGSAAQSLQKTAGNGLHMFFMK